MKASIITPTFNAAAFIEQCILNVAGQGSGVAEHIIVDGGSTDGTLEKVERLMATYPHLRLIPGPDKGQSDAMNKGSRAAKGEVIGFLNADDFYQPSAVEEGLRELEALQGPGVVVGDCRVIDENGETVRWNRPKDLRIQSLVQVQIAIANLLPANPSAYFYHREVHDIVGGYDDTNHYSMDVDFILGAIRLTQARYTPRHWGNFRLMPGCKTYDNLAIKDPLGPILARHRRAMSPFQKMSMPFFSAHTALRMLWWKVKHLLGQQD